MDRQVHLSYYGILGLAAAVLIAGLFVRPDTEAYGIAGTGRCGDKVEEKPCVALTFDDGPGPYTEKLLDGLKKRGAKASFFLIGENISGYENTVRRMKKEGHLIGNHTESHVKLSALSDKEAAGQIQLAGDRIFRLTGTYTAYVRPPYGAWKKGLDLKITMIPVLWDVDSLDWEIRDTSAVTSRVLSQAQCGDIILLHDIFDTSVEAALHIVDALQKKDFQFVTVEDIILL